MWRGVEDREDRFEVLEEFLGLRGEGMGFESEEFEVESSGEGILGERGIGGELCGDIADGNDARLEEGMDLFLDGLCEDIGGWGMGLSLDNLGEPVCEGLGFWEGFLEE